MRSELAQISPRPGAVARAWLEELARLHGGFGALASAAGLSKAWASKAERRVVTVPRAATARALARVYGVSAEDLRNVLDDIRWFSYEHVAPMRHPKPTCTACGRVQTRGGNARRGRSFNATALTYLCRECAGSVEVVCPDCKTPRTLRPRSQFKARDHQVDLDGIVFVRCSPCNGQRTIGTAQRARLVDVIGGRVVAIRQMGPETDGDHALLRYLQAHGVKLVNAAAYLTVRKQSVDGAEVLRQLKHEDLLRTLGAGDLQKGRERRLDVFLEGRDRNKNQAHPGKSVTTVLAARLTGTLCLCCLCGLLIYRSIAHSRRVPSGRAYHQPCGAFWAGTAGVRQWLRAQSEAPARGIAVELLDDYPVPPPLFPKGAPVPTAVSLLSGYRALIAHARGSSAGVLAEAAGISRQGMQQRIQAMGGRLPADWALVFNSGGNGARQRIYPLPHVGPGQIAAANRMASLGVGTDTVLRVTGVDEQSLVVK